MKSQALPQDINGQRICQLFTYPWKWITKPLDDLKGEWKTNDRYPIKPRVLYAKWQDAGTLVGVRFGSATRYAMIDIDAGSEYLDAVGTVLGALETIGINRTVALRSSWSGGLHIYCPLPQAYPTFSVACAVKQALEAQGLTVAPGQLEVFPNEKSYGRSFLGEFVEYNGHRLPLQPGTGSCLLDDDLQPMDAAYSLSRFFALWDNALIHNSHGELAEALCVARSNRRRRRRSLGKVQEWKDDLETIIAEGWTGHGQTNELLKAIGTYGRVFKAMPVYDLADYIESTATHCPGFFQYSSHQHNIKQRALAWAMAINKFYWPLGEEPLRDRKTLEDVCFERAIEAQARIKVAIDRFRTELEGLSIKAMAQRICELAKCSAATLYKYRYLWHPENAVAPSPGHLENDLIGEPIARPVTPQPEGITGDMATILAQIQESLKSTENQGVTRLGGENEACNVKTAFKKSLPPEGREGGAGGREGLSPGGWLPALDWTPGAVDDCHA